MEMHSVSDVKNLLSVIQDNASVTGRDDVAAADECLTPPYSSLNSSTGSPCSTVTDSQGPHSPLFQDDLSPVAIEGALTVPVHCRLVRQAAPPAAAIIAKLNLF